jgi:ureidoglycolate hydrolase
VKMEVKKISSSGFKNYGSAVTLPKGEPTSQGPDYKFWSDISDYHIDGETEIGICTVYKQENQTIQGVERHLNTPEILIPIDAPFILPVLQDGKEKSELEYFEVGIGEAVVINKAVWHGACMPVGKEESSYFVIFRKNTPHEDVEKK